MLKKNLILLVVLLKLSACLQKEQVEIRDDFQEYYTQYKVEGSFLLYDQNKDKYTVCNQKQIKQLFTPASTFKICNSLIGLETGVIKDANFIIPWDSVIRKIPVWNMDHNLKSAFKNSVVWYYQELARRVGSQQMKYWLDKTQYGNTDIGDGIDQFWLTGMLRISPEQQIEFLKKLYNNQLPFSQRTIDIVKEIMVIRDSSDYVVRGKTGWGSQENKDIGWYVGYVETKNNVYFFSNCIQTSEYDHPDFARARIAITDSILKELKVINEY